MFFARRQHDERAYTGRLLVFYLLIGLCGVLLVTALGYQQLVRRPIYAEVEERQNYRRIILPAPRGEILDRRGRILAGNRAVFSAVVYLNDLRRDFRREYFAQVRELRERGIQLPRQELNTRARVAVVQRYLDPLNGMLGRAETVDAEDLERHFSQQLLLPFPLIRDLRHDEFARVVAQLPATSPVQIVTQTARTYPHETIAAQVLGFVSPTATQETSTLPGEDLTTFQRAGLSGRTGIEIAFDDDLTGRPGYEIWTVDPGGFQHERVDYEPPSPGEPLALTLDLDVHGAAEQAMSGRAGAFVALEIETGEVRALGSMPTFDLNELTPIPTNTVYQRILEEGAFLNRGAQGLYPPGSTFKLITALAGLRHGAITTETVVNCPGFHLVGRRIFHCNNRAGHGDMGLIEAIRDSCNVYFYERGLEMGAQAIADEARLFGLDDPTGIEWPGETRRSLVPDPAWKRGRFFGEGWYGGDTANMSIGQGFLLVTPLQMATVVASLVRGETRTQPTLFPVGAEPGELHPEARPIGLPAAAIDAVLAGMREAGRTGTARRAGREGLPVAGKTGTAQVRKDGQPTTLAWFVGYAPAEAPRLAIAVMVEGVPEEASIGGGSTAAPIARAMLEAYFAADNAEAAGGMAVAGR